MTAAEFMHERCVLMLAIRDIDSRLIAVFGGDGTYRASDEARQLLETRSVLVEQLARFNGEAPALPQALGF